MSGDEASKPAEEEDGAATMARLERAVIDRGRVDLAKVCGDRAGRARVFRILYQVHVWGLVREVAPYVRVEKGAVQRGEIAGENVREYCFAAISTGLRLFDDLESLVQRVVGAWPEFGNLGLEASSYEQIVMEDLQEWLDDLAASQKPMNGFVLEMIAGFAGCSVEGLRRFNASTGVEAGLRVSWSIRNAIAEAMPHPFLWLGLILGEQRQTLPATGRPRPSSPVDTAEDDREILLAVAEGAKTPKEVFAKMVARGLKVKQPHIRKRKKDLVTWQLLEAKHGVWKFTSLGEEWVRELRQPQRSSPGAAT